MLAFAGEPTAGRVPSVRVIRARPHTGQPPGGYRHTWPRSTAQAGVSLEHPAAVPAAPPPAASRDPTSQHEISALMGAGLLDELCLWVHPFFVGTGTASDLLYRAGSSGSFELAGSASLGSGIVILIYQSTAR